MTGRSTTRSLYRLLAGSDQGGALLKACEQLLALAQ